MNLLDIIHGQYRLAGRKDGGEYHGACPWCGDGGKGSGSDRFHIWPEQGRHGTYWCRMCGKGGDAIKYLIDHDGLSFLQAVEHLGMHPDELGPRRNENIPVGWRPSAATRPADVWAEKAKKFALWCHERLLERPDELGWLEQRGIGLDMVRKYRLGWNPTHAWREGSAWGVTMAKKDNGQLKKLWLPRGLVIPMFSSFGENSKVLRLRIRQPDQGPRYMVIPGSSREPLCSRAAEAMIVVESELDAILLDGVAGDLVGVVAMGNDTAKPTEKLLPKVQEALVVLVSLDSDLPKFNENTGTMDIPGAKASRWWLEQFATAVRVPVIGGKDPGEAYAAGVDLRSWVMAALPPYFHVKAELEAARTKKEKERAADEATRAEGESEAEEIIETPAPAQPEVAEVAAPPPEDGEKIGVRTLTLTNGRSFSVTADRAEWQRLADDGQIVFSDYELQRLQDACRTMSPGERFEAAMQVLDVKEIFGNAWIRRGVAVDG